MYLVTSKERHSGQANSKLEHDDDYLLAALQSEGVQPVVIPWDACVEDSSNAIVVLRNSWDYYKDVKGFVSWTESCKGRLFNPPNVVSWNASKIVYLRDLASKGVPTVPSQALHPGDDLCQVLLKTQWIKGAILKPATSVGAFDTVRIKDIDTAEAQRLFNSQATSRDFLLQPFLSSIQTEGEVSMVYINGAFSHAVKKVPECGDYRAHFLYNATVTKFVPSDAHFQVTEQVFKAFVEISKLLYARIDLVTGDDGKLCVIELELIEPMLYFNFEPSAARVFAKAVKDLLVIQ